MLRRECTLNFAVERIRPIRDFLAVDVAMSRCKVHRRYRSAAGRRYFSSGGELDARQALQLRTGNERSASDLDELQPSRLDQGVE